MDGQVVPRWTARTFKTEEIHCPIEQKKRDLFDELITCNWGTSPPPLPKPTSDMEFDVYEDEEESLRVTPVTEDPVDSNGVAIIYNLSMIG